MPADSRCVLIRRLKGVKQTLRGSNFSTILWETFRILRRIPGHVINVYWFT